MPAHNDRNDRKSALNCLDFRADHCQPKPRHPVRKTIAPIHRLSQRKPNGLPYKWPLLADGQDPDALEARLAYHLHRLNLTGESLREALKGKAYLATALSQGRASVDQDFVTELATSLNIASDELSRPPNESEAREWGFYRTSARSPRDVWRHASHLWAKHGVSDKQAATIIGMKHPNLSRALNGKPTDVFQWHHAQRLSEAIDLGPPERFLPPDLRDTTDEPSR